MFFLRKKKHRRDQEAGLVFHWRGAKKHHLGKLIALVVVASCFSFAVYAVRIDGLKKPLVSKRTATLIMLNEDDPNCQRILLQVEEKSPFPSRWDPAHDLDTRERIAARVEAVMGRAWEYQPELRSVPPTTGESTALASILEPDVGLLSGMMRNWTQELETQEAHGVGDPVIRGSVRVSGELEKRLSAEQWALPANLVTEDWFGQSFRFMLGVDENGIVRSCVPLPGGSMGVVRATDRQQDLSVWLRVQRFKPASEKGMVFGELHLQIQAIRR